ncbi:MAG: hypothetical protein QOD90_5969 [Mycobacterium sp.]|jgi:hypothetical protein|nr:hypothetical protein [Mycobacterium sp.]
MRALSVILLAIGTAIGAAPPAAAAGQADYLAQLQPRFAYLTADQLLAEGFKVCRYVSAGRATPGAVNMVQSDLVVNELVASAIVAAAIANFGC